MAKMNKLLAWVGLVMAGISSLSSPSYAWRLIEADEVSIKYRDFVHPGRNAYIYPEPLKDGVALNLNTTFLDLFYWNSTIDALTTPAKYEFVSLTTEVGLRVTENIQIFFQHFSGHLLDREQSYLGKYPVNDSVGFNLILYSAGKRRETVF